MQPPCMGVFIVACCDWGCSKVIDSKRCLLQVHLQGKVEAFQDDVFVVNGSGQTRLLAEAGMAVITVRAADECYFQTMNVKIER